MTKRMVIATLALAGVGVATYLSLYSLGALGELACGSGGCATVQASRWSNFIGLPVAVWGLGFYIALFVVAMVSTRPGQEGSVVISNLMLAMTGWGFLFSAWLTWIELGVIRAICRYCVVSALIATAAFVVSLLEWRELRRSEPAV